MSSLPASADTSAVPVFLLTLAGTACLLCLAPPAAAGIIGDRVVTVEATDATGTFHGSTTFDVPEDGTLVWPQPPGSAEREIRDPGGTLLATVYSIVCQVVDDPAVLLGFVVTAGATDTDLTVTSPTLSFAAMTDPDAHASPGITLTDGTGDGATATGLQAGSKVYQARYNAGTEWANLIPTLSAGANFTNSDDDRRPGAGWETIPGTLTSIQAEYKFTLTAGDMASGTSRFEVVPEPATLGFVGLGLLALALGRRGR